MEGQDPTHLVGTVLADRYRVQGLLGTGSMSAVYEVMDQHAGVHAAMKVLLPALGEDPVIAARFAREAKAMCLFEHRNIVDLRDLGRLDGGTPFLITDLVQGVSLRDLIADGVIDPRRALSIIRQVIEALAHAHAVGVIHRDIKPENVMLVDGGSPDEATDLVKVLDFGVAKLVGDSGSLLGESTLTQAGCNALGSPLYMAPEPLLGQPIDARADLYSVGVVLFELLTGRPPFFDEDPVVLARLHVAAPVPSLAQSAPERMFTPQLEYLVGEALAKKPEHRFGSAAEMLGALDAANRSLDPILGGGTIQSLVPPLAAMASARSLIAEPPPAPSPSGPPRSAPASPAGSARARIARLITRLTRLARATRARTDEARRFRWIVAGIGLLATFAAIASVAGGGGAADGDQASAVAERTPAMPRTTEPADQPRRAETGADFLERGHAALERGRRLDALAAYERAIQLSPELAGDGALRAKVASIVDTRDTVAAVVALEVLATRVRPAAHDAIVAQASNGKLAEVRHRAFAIAERDGFADRVDRTESWSLDLKQAATCDERKGIIAKLRSTADRRAVAALRHARAQYACVARDATAAIAQLEAEPKP